MTSDSKQQKKNRKGNGRGMSAASRANLETGRNKHGAPRKGLSWKELIAEIGEEVAPPSLAREGATWKEVVIRAAFRHAAAGNAAILRELMARSELQPNEIVIRHDGDWRQAARMLGLEESEVLAEAERLINESHSLSSDQELGDGQG